MLGNKKPTDSQNRQLVSDALVRKDSVKDVNVEYVQNCESVNWLLTKKYKRRYISCLSQTLKAIRALKENHFDREMPSSWNSNNE